LSNALERIEFFYLVGHDLDWSLVDEARLQALRFFNSPPAVKEAVASTRFDHPGYRQGADLYYSEEGSPPARNDVWSMFPERRGRNRWPDLVGFREAMITYVNAVEHLGFSLLVPIARTLRLRDDYFTSRFEQPMASLGARYYPVCQYEEGQWGLGAHSDSGFLTILPDNNVPGLSIRVSADNWIDAPSLPKSFLVNSGTYLRRWTNDRFLSTEHRVLNTSGIERVGLPFFYLPDPGTEVAPLPTCVDEANPPRYEPVVSDPTRYEDEPIENFPEGTRIRAHVNYKDSPEQSADSLIV
jgi:isopenicillin N synthase-like dioxygenase